MFSAIYIEEEVANTDRVLAMLDRFPSVPHIACERYGEVFNRKAQNFRMQKKAPALILAKKHGKLVLPAPAGYGFDASASFYFSHMLNCVYDCRYCFLQGMYRSANYVLFTNYEDFSDEISATLRSVDGPSVFYSGYDCDSLALEPVSDFCRHFVPMFAGQDNATIEIRTKSTQIRHLLEMPVVPNCVIAMSFTAEEAAQRWEHKVPAIEKRIAALRKLQVAGWQVAIRFEPIIFEQVSSEPSTEASYAKLFQQIFDKIDAQSLHSVSTGLFRMPSNFHKNIVKLYPDEALYAQDVVNSEGMVALAIDGESERLASIERCLFKFISARQYYRCA